MNEQTPNPNATNEGINEQAAVSSLPVSPESKPEVVTEVQPEVQKETDSQAADKRKQVLHEAVSALSLTKSALAALDGKDTARALATLAEVTGKLELIVAREPTLALAGVDVRTIVHDLFANTETIEAMTDEALDALKHGEVQQARHVLALLASEIVITVTNIPLASYPAAVKAVVPLIDQGKIEEAKAALLQARCEKLTDIPEKVDFFDALPDYDVEFFTNKKSKTNAEVSKAMLEAAIPALEGLDGWTTEGIHDALIALAEKLAVKNATLMWPVRIAAAGKAVTPGGAVEICHILGKDECLRRLRLGLDKLGG